MALRLGRLFNQSPQLKMNLQARYDLESAKDRFGENIARITPYDRVGQLLVAAFNGVLYDIVDAANNLDPVTRSRRLLPNDYIGQGSAVW